MVIDLVIVTAPNPPGSRQLMMPGLAVLEIAPAKVLHGAVRLHGLTSSPTPETHVRVAWAFATTVIAIESKKMREAFFILDSSYLHVSGSQMDVWRESIRYIRPTL